MSKGGKNHRTVGNPAAGDEEDDGVSEDGRCRGSGRFTISTTRSRHLQPPQPQRSAAAGQPRPPTPLALQSATCLRHLQTEELHSRDSTACHFTHHLPLPASHWIWATVSRSF
jgi:hypothetical protein